MKTDLKEMLEKIMQEHSKPSTEQRIQILEQAIADLALQTMGAEINE